MRKTRRICRLWGLAGLVLLLGACATPQPRDYTEFKQSRPRSILVLPPVNNSPEVGAVAGFYAQVTYPLAESGYYVFPVTLVDETFKQNGMSVPSEIQAVAPAKLREIFGADAAMYITITEYGASYQVMQSVVTVSASAKLVDLRTGTLLWQGAATASDKEGSNSNSGGILGQMIGALIDQVVNSVTDSSYPIAGKTSMRLLMAHPNGMLYGPYSPRYKTDGGGS